MSVEATHIDDMPKRTAIIMAAGKGTRMQSDLPKVVHPVAGEPMVRWVVRACAEAGCQRIVVVVGYQQETVRNALLGVALPAGAELVYALQDEQLGTGHAVMCAADAVLDAGDERHAVFVLAGDGPLIRSSTLEGLVELHDRVGASATLATAVIDDPSGYGRIVRDSQGGFQGIVEQKNASEEQLKIREVNPSYYCFEARELFASLKDVTRNELTGEYYITDVPGMLLEGGRRVEVIDSVPPEDILSINTLEHLAAVDAVLRARLGMDAANAEEGA